MTKIAKIAATIMFLRKLDPSLFKDLLGAELQILWNILIKIKVTIITPPYLTCECSVIAPVMHKMKKNQTKAVRDFRGLDYEEVSLQSRPIVRLYAQMPTKKVLEKLGACFTFLVSILDNFATVCVNVLRVS